jgi:hypothetical protein
MVYAICNTQANEVMAGNEYMNSIGRKRGNRRYMNATNGWDMFRGSCALLAEQSWARNEAVVEGVSHNNPFWYPLYTELKLDVDILPFRCETRLPWWEAQFGDINKLRINFVSMLRGLPQNIWGQWKGLLIAENDVLRITQPFTTPECSATWLSATPVQRYVLANPVFDILQYNSFDDGSWVEAGTWRNLGGFWGSVYRVASDQMSCCHCPIVRQVSCACSAID